LEEDAFSNRNDMTWHLIHSKSQSAGEMSATESIGDVPHLADIPVHHCWIKDVIILCLNSSHYISSQAYDYIEER